MGQMQHEHLTFGFVADLDRSEHVVWSLDPATSYKDPYQIWVMSISST